MLIWAHFTNFFWHHNTNSMENSFSCNSVTGNHITTTFCTWNDSAAFVPLARCYSDHFVRIGMRAISFALKLRLKFLVKWDPEINTVWLINTLTIENKITGNLFVTLELICDIRTDSSSTSFVTSICHVELCPRYYLHYKYTNYLMLYEFWEVWRI